MEKLQFVKFIYDLNKKNNKFFLKGCVDSNKKNH